MIKVEAYYYDGKSSQRLAVTVNFHLSGQVIIEGESIRHESHMEDIDIAPRLGNTPRSLFLKNGIKLETTDNDAMDKVEHYFSQNIYHAVLHKLEKNYHYVTVSVLLTICFIWITIEFGLPYTAKKVAENMPMKIERQIGQQGLEALDDWLLSDSQISQQQQQHLINRFQTLLIEIQPHYSYQLEIRHSKKLGANALALPGGIIIVTDSLIKLAENDEQILAVLAHEMGHIEFQHGLRSLLQNSFSALFMAAVLGDISSISSLSVTLPTALLESRYSRKFELQADQYASQLLAQQNIAIGQFISILSRLQNEHRDEDEFDYLSSHPAMNKRINKLQKPTLTVLE